MMVGEGSHERLADRTRFSARLFFNHHHSAIDDISLAANFISARLYDVNMLIAASAADEGTADDHRIARIPARQRRRRRRLLTLLAMPPATGKEGRRPGRHRDGSRSVSATAAMRR